ncbi:hypothetical protein HY990_04345 [Candidatus Micrarchaeota archaeon]|nr:hypothetical protein [Candidatus Micrarchaeota archaeon]
MTVEKLGCELELLLERDGIPIYWQDWVKLLDALRSELSELGIKEKRDLITHELLGFDIPGYGNIAPDSNSALAEIAVDPCNSKKELFEKLKFLYDKLEKCTKKIGVQIVWGSQHKRPPLEQEYWDRVAKKGLYTVVRKIWGWKHHEMHLSASFQPAIDIEVGEFSAFNNAISATSPIAICYLGGSTPTKGNENETYYEYRLHGWTRMLGKQKSEQDILGAKRFVSHQQYMNALLSQRARIVALEKDYKVGKLVYFDEKTTAREVLNGITGHRIEEVIDYKRDELKTSPVQIEGQQYINQMDWWVFWDARWKFAKNEKDEFTKSFIEIRHMGTPSSYDKLEKIMDFFIRLRDSAKKVNELAERHNIWDNLEAARDQAIKTGTLPINHQAFANDLITLGILEKLRLHS